MDTPNLYDKLYQAVSEGNPETIFKYLIKVEDKEMRNCMEALVRNDCFILTLVQGILSTHELDYAMHYFCDLVLDTEDDTFITFSTKGYSPSVEKSPLLTEEVKSRLYTAIIHLCAYAQIEKSSFIFIGLSSTKDRLSVVLDTEVPFFNSIDNTKNVAICLALNHIKRIGAKLKSECIGLTLDLFRLTLTLDLEPRQGQELIGPDMSKE